MREVWKGAGLGSNCAVEASSRKKFELPRPRQRLTQERTSSMQLPSAAGITNSTLGINGRVALTLVRCAMSSCTRWRKSASSTRNVN
jgi:hypothetical protein